MTPQEKARALRPLIEKAAVSLTDTDALEAVELFPLWKPDTDYAKEDGKPYRVRDPEDGLLYSLIPDTHHSQADWPPHLVPAIWQKVEKPGQGDTPDNPIPWSWGLILNLGKYYSDKGVLYRCIRDSGIGIHADLSALVGNYVEVVE